MHILCITKVMTKIELGNRKINKINYTYTISIPKVWVDNAQVKENDQLHLWMDDKKRLIIEPEDDKDEKIQ